MMRGHAELVVAVVAVAALAAGLLRGKSRRKLIAYLSALVIAVSAGVALWLTAAPTGPTRGEGASGPVAAVETAPFAGALDALTTSPEVRYRGSVPGVGAVDVKVTNFGQLIGSLTEDGGTLRLLVAGGRLYVKPSAFGLRGVTSAREATALKGKWLTGSTVQSLLGSIPAQFVPPAQLATKLASALGAAPALKGRAEIAGVPVLGADTSLGVLYVSANTPYRIVSLSPKASPGPAPAFWGAAELTAYAEPGGDGISFPADSSSGEIANTDRQLGDEVRQLAAASIHGCRVPATVARLEKAQ